MRQVRLVGNEHLYKTKLYDKELLMVMTVRLIIGLKKNIYEDVLQYDDISRYNNALQDDDNYNNISQYFTDDKNI
ncbi:437_t:CDS:2 [Funneliformis mosseae]|uniref:437_t:CDS:1 n=1 Tax=Funneliformis mosseae TaxID=27381 RepID=A0A9N9BFT8_FUNMO|nr:437_t:CDS:2 [Funneliformis mosseae]